MINGMALVDQLYDADRVIFTATLSIDGAEFLQPTGFPDIGACVYIDGDGKRRCLIESEQSMANRLEAVCMSPPGYWADDLCSLPVIEIRDGDRSLLGTNLTEPHRIASSYLLEGKIEHEGSDLKSKIEQKIGLTDGGKRWPLGKRPALERLVFALDPAALLHGFQFVGWPFVGLRQTRVLSSRIECELREVSDVDYGMVKFDLIDPRGHDAGTNKGQSIAAKRRVVPIKDSIKATFDIDVLALKNLSLDELKKDDDDLKKFLLGLALWKIGTFLSNRAAFDARSRQVSPSLRLRADCYFTCKAVTWIASGSHMADSCGDTHANALRVSLNVPNFYELAGKVGLTLTKPKNGDRQPLTLSLTYAKAASSAPLPQSGSETGADVDDSSIDS